VKVVIMDAQLFLALTLLTVGTVIAGGRRMRSRLAALRAQRDPVSSAAVRLPAPF